MFGIEPGSVDIKSISQPGVIDAVGVLLPETGPNGVEMLRYLGGLNHHDIVGKTGVHRQRDAVRGNGGTGVEIGDIHLRMDAGVRAPRPGTLDGVAHHRGEGLFQRLGHGDGVLLHLPAVVGGAHVHQFQGNISLLHGASRQKSVVRRSRMTTATRTALPTRVR